METGKSQEREKRVCADGMNGERGRGCLRRIPLIETHTWVDSGPFTEMQDTRGGKKNQEFCRYAKFTVLTKTPSGRGMC